VASAISLAHEKPSSRSLSEEEKPRDGSPDVVFMAGKLSA